MWEENPVVIGPLLLVRFQWSVLPPSPELLFLVLIEEFVLAVRDGKLTGLNLPLMARQTNAGLEIL